VAITLSGSEVTAWERVRERSERGCGSLQSFLVIVGRNETAYKFQFFHYLARAHSDIRTAPVPAQQGISYCVPALEAQRRGLW
jgi:hypothetical protein